MNKILSLFLMATMAILAGCSENDQPKEGVQYETLANNLATYRLPPVTEVFSLNCGHCRTMEEVIPQLESLTNQSIGKVHVTFNESAQVAAMIYYTAEMQLGGKPDEEMLNELFAALQMGNGATMTDKQRAIESAFHSRNLVSPYELDKAQQAQMFRAIKIAEEITTKGQFKGVPTFVVNGKYVVLTSGHQNVEGIAETINYLINLK